MLIFDKKIKLRSVNNKYSISRTTGRLFVKKEYREFKDCIKKNCLLSGEMQGPYSVKIDMETHLDIDNPVKAILDGMASAGIISDDKEILSLVVSKTKTKRNREGRLRIWLSSLDV